MISPGEGTHSMSRERVVVTLPRPLLKVIVSGEDGTDRLEQLKEAIQVCHTPTHTPHSHTLTYMFHTHTQSHTQILTPQHAHDTHSHTSHTFHTHSTQESCKEDESLLNEFLSAITDLSQQFEGVAPCIIDLSPLEHVPDQEPQSIELQFEQRSCLLLSLTDSMGCVACYCNVCLL